MASFIACSDLKHLLYLEIVVNENTQNTFNGRLYHTKKDNLFIIIIIIAIITDIIIIHKRALFAKTVLEARWSP